MLRHTGVVMALIFMTGASDAVAQSRFSMELRGGPAFPTADLSQTKLRTGAGFDFAVGLRLQEHLGAYAAWDWHRFVTDEPFAGGEFDVEDTGYGFGVQFRHPFTDAIGGWLRVGGVYDHIELEDDEGDIIADSGHELGWEAGGGLLFPVTRSFALAPGIRYRTFSATLRVNDAAIPVDLTYLAAEIGITWTPGGRTLSAARAR